MLCAITADGDLQRVLYVIPTAGVDLIETTKADVDRNFSDEWRPARPGILDN